MLGLAKLPDGKLIDDHSAFEYQRVAKAVRINGGNRKRGLMAWAASLVEHQISSQRLINSHATENCSCIYCIHAIHDNNQSEAILKQPEKPMQHLDQNVQQALAKLNDALCTWERETGRQSILIIKDDSPTWEHVINFAERMEKKLDINRHKGNREGWLSMSKAALLHRVREELLEVDKKLFSSHSAQDIADECADVANFCMMLADKVLESVIPPEAE